MIFFLYILRNDLPHNRFAISINKKIDNAARRNYIKRVMKESFRLNQHLVSPGYDLWIVMKKTFSRKNRRQVVQLFSDALTELRD